MTVEPTSGTRYRAPKTSELIAKEFRRQIVRGELPPGTMLPSESDLMVQLGVSRPTLREAYRLLEAESLLEIRRGVGGGARVISPDVGTGAHYVGLLLQLDGATIADVYEARTILEPICAGLMAGRRDADANQSLFDSIAGLEKLIKATDNGVPEPRPWSEATYRFHELVVKGCGNKTLALQGQLLQEVVATHYAATIAPTFDESERPGRFKRVLASFRKLANLIAEGDRAAAEEHWTTHMRTAATTLLGDDVKNTKIVDLFG
ncbi:FadR/GntR family transcriptional regulator [Amycolatopsis rhabdoformis]|uniref:FadR/GntR family transcriptional regulator n=1 Tax=Amycolatopsis rhabdoformis TaxID=1448059 RepID=A0ABZ1IDP4_9PSEU|nr:FadR/GntR family transcriptional regulator [Amycolatopsis rhabdoformis]WSE32570.1 FadR/GntR family transcriptional regulator [Amycolatopsis rhabdoformis]